LGAVKVTALLVSHDGARWLPAVLDGLDEQTRAPDRVVAVDTGSADASPDLLGARLDPSVILRLGPDTSFPDAVGQALTHLPPRVEGDEPEWVWLLHDDCRPAPDALERLVGAAVENPSVALLGPKLREWPSLRRLLEVGLTISGTGRRESGLERGEYDQGQHDRVRDVLAVSSAGMLARRDVLEELGGFDRRLPMFGNDLDLGWRAARAGHRSMVVPSAVCFHVEAAHRGVRRTPVTGNHRRGERRAALYTLLVNCSALALPFLAVRLVLGTLLRVLGLLLVRAPREAADEVVALVAAYSRPDLVLRGRLERRRTSRVRPREVRHLLAPFWLPYRHGLDVVSDIASAVAHQAADVSAARRPARAAETGPVPDESENLPDDSGVLARLATSPVAVVFAALVVLALVAGRGLYGGGFLSGGALLPAPGSAHDWWRLYLERWHPAGVGSDLAAAPYVAALAAAGTLLLGKAWLVIDVLFLLAVPLAAWGAWRFLRPLTSSSPAALWGAVTYALFPALAGAVGQGRLGTVAAAVLLPWVARAALFLGAEHSRDRRWRAAWRTALLLALLTAFAPVAWPIAVALAVGALVTGMVRDRRAWSRPSAWAPTAVSVAVVPVLLLPWLVGRLTGGAPGPWYAEAGLPATDLLGSLGAWELLGSRPTDAAAAAPAWISIGLTVAAVGALLPRSTRPRVLAAWAVVAVGLVATLWLDLERAWAGVPVLFVHAGLVTAVSLVAPGVAALLSGASFGWRQPVSLLVVAGAVLAPVAGLLWWVAAGAAGPLVRAPAHAVPTYMVDAAQRDPDQGVLVLREEGEAVGYTLLRDAGARIGDDSVTPSGARQDRLTGLVTDLVTDPAAEHVERLSRFGVEFVYVQPPAPPGVVSGLDVVSGLTPASAPLPGARGWQLETEPSRAAVPASPGPWHPVLLGVQALAILIAAVLAAPSRRTRR
jgi:GT2 family glycosyltransferase